MTSIVQTTKRYTCTSLKILDGGLFPCNTANKAIVVVFKIYMQMLASAGFPRCTTGFANLLEKGIVSQIIMRVGFRVWESYGEFTATRSNGKSLTSHLRQRAPTETIRINTSRNISVCVQERSCLQTRTSVPASGCHIGRIELAVVPKALSTTWASCLSGCCSSRIRTTKTVSCRCLSSDMGEPTYRHSIIWWTLLDERCWINSMNAAGSQDLHSIPWGNSDSVRDHMKSVWHPHAILTMSRHRADVVMSPYGDHGTHFAKQTILPRSRERLAIRLFPIVQWLVY